jgi:hypothetical protein
MALWLDAFETVLKEIKELVGKKKEKKQKAFEACEAIQRAANKTTDFLTSSSKKTKPNKELSDIWLDAAKAVRDLDVGIYNRLLAKAEYWSNPRDWTKEKVEEANIRLDSLRKDSKAMIEP